GPALRRAGGAPIVAPRDRQAGGTWLGVNAQGLFAGVLNRPTERPDPERRSRGLLVLDALRARTACEAAESLRRLPGGAYNPFNLFLGDGVDAFAIVYKESPDVSELGPGPHVLGNADPDSRRVPKLARLFERTERLASRSAKEAADGLVGLCRTHAADPDPRQSVCVHAGPYGTRSSAVLVLAERPGERVFRFADGPPCTSEYEDFTHLLNELETVSRAERDDTNVRKAT
ncbi:MAG: NRDE family protein, partial [Deltaproteobacteria bacterium]